MKELVVKVIQARERATVLKGEYDRAKASWVSAHLELSNALATAQAEVEVVEHELREAALDTYKATGDKRPVPGVEVKMGTRLVYDTAVAQLWGYEHGVALTLDKKVFEKIAKASPPDFVTLEQVPFATIATDLKVEPGD